VKKYLFALIILILFMVGCGTDIDGDMTDKSGFSENTESIEAKDIEKLVEEIDPTDMDKYVKIVEVKQVKARESDNWSEAEVRVQNLSKDVLYMVSINLYLLDSQGNPITEAYAPFEHIKPNYIETLTVPIKKVPEWSGNLNFEVDFAWKFKSNK